MFKRVGLFILTNIFVIVTLGIVLNILGVNHYITAQGLDYKSLAIFCLVWGMGGALISLGISRWMAKKMMNVQLVSPTGPQGALVRRVHAIARKANLPVMPEVGIFDSEAINAFATGPSRSRSLVAVSTGLLRKMGDEEVEGVLAHEVAHIANGDMVTMTLLQGVVNAFVMFLARVVAYFIANAMRSNDRDGGQMGWFAHMMVVFVLEIIFGILASTVVMWFSRWREYRADAGSATLVGKHKMVAALEALRRDYGVMAESAQAPTSARVMGISSKSSFMQLFSSHPSLENRIRALKG